MQLARILAVWVMLAIAAAPVRAQVAASPPPPAAAPGVWQSAVALADDAVQIVLWPVRSLWSAITGLFFSVEQAAAAARVEFRGMLQTDMERFEEFVILSGFRLSRVEVRATLVPEIELFFERQARISAEAEAALRDRLHELRGVIGEMEQLVIRGLLDLHDRIDAVRPKHYRVAEVRMALVAIIPEVVVAFVKGEEGEEGTRRE